MRFERLELLRYGALTDAVLRFRPGARLHLVYGRNEAGKSSALAAMSDLLFGFPKARQFDFLHDAASLRIGAALRADDGTGLELRRRRGNKNTLLSPDAGEAPLRDDVLAPFLGALGRDMFGRAFGLDSDRLRAGAEEMLRSEGELGETLFAAASGLVGLSRIRAGLEQEADGIFAPRASKDRLFYQIRDRHQEAQRAERQSLLRDGDWKTLLAELAELDARHQDLQDKRLATRHALSRLQALRQVQPILAEIDAETAELAAMGALDALPEGLADRLAAALGQCQGAQKDVERIGQERRDLAAQAEAVAVDTALIAQAEAITALFAQSGDYAAKRRDLPRIEHEHEHYLDQIRGLSRRLGLAGETPEAHQPADAALARAKALVATGRQLADAIAGLNARIADERRALDALAADRAEADLVDIRPWRDRLDALDPEIKAIERRAELETRHRAGQRQLAEAAARLNPPIADLDRLAAHPLPGLGHVAEHKAALDRLDQAWRGLDDRRRALAEDAARLERAIARAEQGGPVPSRQAILAARAARQAAFERFRADASSLAGFIQASDEADRLADQALAEADRVSRHAADRLRQAELADALAELEAQQSRAEAERQAARAAFAALFAPLGIPVLAPAEMAAWLKAVLDLLAQRQDVLDLGDEIAAADALAATLQPALDAIAGAVGAAAGLPVLAQKRALDDRLRRLADQWSQSRSVAGKRDETARRLAGLEAELAQTLEREESWWADFARTLPALGLDRQAGPDQAEAAIAAWEQVPPVLFERDNRARRVAGMRRDIAAFERQARELAGLLLPGQDLPTPAAMADALAKALDRARADQVRRAGLDEALARADRALAQAQAEAEAADAALAGLLAGLPAADAGALTQTLRRRDGLRQRLAAGRRRLLDLAEGRSEAEIRQALADFDRDRAGLEIERLEAEEAQLIEEAKRVYARREEKLRQRQALEEGKGAEQAAFEKNAAEAEIVEAARQWVVLRLASTLLGAALEKHRESQADPMLRRAGALFATLTGGSFARLVQDYDETDRPLLCGERAGGERVGIAGMSEGTRDQLYLALRLAFIEDYARRNESAPFIGDDIFQTFDDTRTRAGLLALAETGAAFQPILFTHHRSVVAIAEDALGPDLDLIHLQG